MFTAQIEQAQRYASKFTLQFLSRRLGIVRRRVLAGDIPEIQARDVEELEVLVMAYTLKSQQSTNVIL